MKPSNGSQPATDISSNPKNPKTCLKLPGKLFVLKRVICADVLINNLCILRQFLDSQSRILAPHFLAAQICILVARELIIVTDIVSKTYAEGQPHR